MLPLPSWKKNKNTGAWGEEECARYLQKQGYQILCRNYHSRYGEIDVIACYEDIIAFVEVKTRAKGAIYTPAEAVTPAKQQKIILTAMHYMEEYNVELQPRFDVCEVFPVEGKRKRREAEINYLDNAFQVVSR